MKKLLSIFLCAMFMMGSTIVANAAPEQIVDTGSSTKTVTIASASYEAKYRIDVTWESLEFTYNFTTWDTQDVTYDTSLEGWASNDKVITVENRSNADVKIDATFKANSSTTSNAVNGVTAQITTDDNFILDSADKAGYSSTNLPTKNLKVSVTGRPEVKTTYTLDDIVIKIDKNV